MMHSSSTTVIPNFFLYSSTESPSHLTDSCFRTPSASFCPLCRLDCWLISDHGDPYLRKTLYNRFHSPSIQTDKRFTVDLNAGGTVQGNHLKEQMHAVVKTVPGPGAV